MAKPERKLYKVYGRQRGRPKAREVVIGTVRDFNCLSATRRARKEFSSAGTVVIRVRLAK